MDLLALANGAVSFNRSAIMRRAHYEGRFALAMCRTAAERRRSMSRWLKLAWAAAKAEARDLERRAELAAATRAHLAQRARESVALAASFGNDAAAIRFEIEREHHRQHFDGARIEALRNALSQIGA